MKASIKVREVSCAAGVRSNRPAEILRWDDQTESWTVAGMMETARSYHAMVAVTTDADRFCSAINT